jgi:KaiC/GvpD/RAD55 family RecA-like ATPase
MLLAYHISIERSLQAIEKERSLQAIEKEKSMKDNISVFNKKITELEKREQSIIDNITELELWLNNRLFNILFIIIVIKLI